WVVDLYKKKTREEWSFTEAGVVLLKGENEILVLEEGTHLENALPFIVSNEETVEKYGVAPRVAFDKKFNIIEARDNRVISNFELNTTDEGEMLLDKHFLTNEFPAVIANQGDLRTAYFSGDFATSNIPPWTASFGSLNIFKRFLYNEADPNDTRRFFWLYYRPILTGILNDYYLEKELELE
ncbi:MAG TPA: hypothetical protein VJ877_00045, partial [Bacteroidales bacterium]|nr:hypothetical protein [Bacteroidales bacterium]